MTAPDVPAAPFALLRDGASGRWLLFDRPVAILQADSLAAVPETLRALERAVATRGLWAAGALAYEAAPAFDPALATRPPAPGLPLLWFGLFAEPRTAALPPPAPPDRAAWRASADPDAYRAAFDAVKRHIREGDAYQVNLTYRLRARLNSPPSSLSPHPSSLIPQPSSFIPQPSSFIPQPSSFIPHPSSFTPQPSSLSLHPSALIPQPSALSLQPSLLLPLFSRLVAAQGATYGALIAAPAWSLLSASPELFFSLDGDRLVSRPMKGTAPRGLTADADRAAAAALRASEKNRAENVMIVDMMRHDLGRVAAPGTVAVPDLFALEKYPAVWQMTSTVQARSSAPVTEILSALFPAASVTGAPKGSAMRIIAANEQDPRGFYTGAVGFIAPGRRAQFNVAIRSLFTDAAGAAEFGTGGGVVWDSSCDRERDECRVKAGILNADAAPFSLLETLRWTPAEGFYLPERHLARLAASAGYFDIPADLPQLRGRLADLALTLPPRPHRVRLLLAQDGDVTVEAATFTPAPADAPPLRVAFAPAPVDAGDPFLYHKTTRRRVYEDALASRPGFDDVILWNADGQVTESTRANLAAEFDGRLVTPPVRCGLLAGTLRQELLDAGTLSERALTREDLLRSPRLLLFNALRGLMTVTLLDGRAAT